MKKVRWGVLGVAGIAMRRVIPGMRDCRIAEVTAIASRDLDRAKHAAKTLGLPRAHGSYEDLLRDPVYTHDIVTGLLVTVGYVALFVSLAWARFAGKDVTS